MIFDKTPNITVEFIRLLIRNSQLTVFRPKNNMIQKFSVAHIFVSLCRTPCGSISVSALPKATHWVKLPKLRIGLSIVKCSALPTSINKKLFSTQIARSAILYVTPNACVWGL